MMSRDSKYHPLDTRYRGPSTAYRGSTRKREERAAAPASPAARPAKPAAAKANPWRQRDRTAPAARPKTPANVRSQERPASHSLLGLVTGIFKTIGRVYFAFLLIVLGITFLNAFF